MPIAFDELRHRDARTGASSAVGVYVSCYYVGGSAGSVLPGFAWHAAGWPGCVALTAAVLVVMAAIVWAAWGDAPSPSNP